MPRDVATRWNSTYHMLEFALEYKEAVDAMTGDKALKLRSFELSEEEWGIAAELRDLLRVSLQFNYVHSIHPSGHPSHSALGDCTITSRARRLGVSARTLYNLRV